jgi:hypothetical protein
MADCPSSTRFSRSTLALTPLFEAISNALHAIALGGKQPGRIQVEIVRDKRQGHLDLSEAEYPVRDIIVSDSGVGFTQENYDALGVLTSKNNTAPRALAVCFG